MDVIVIAVAGNKGDADQEVYYAKHASNQVIEACKWDWSLESDEADLHLIRGSVQIISGDNIPLQCHWKNGDEALKRLNEHIKRMEDDRRYQYEELKKEFG